MAKKSEMVENNRATCMKNQFWNWISRCRFSLSEESCRPQVKQAGWQTECYAIGGQKYADVHGTLPFKKGRLPTLWIAARIARQARRHHGVGVVDYPRSRCLAWCHASVTISLADSPAYNNFREHYFASAFLSCQFVPQNGQTRMPTCAVNSKNRRYSHQLR